MEYIKAQRKFVVCMLFTVASIVGLFTGYIGEGSFIALAGLLTGIYGASNVGQRMVEARKGSQP